MPRYFLSFSHSVSSSESGAVRLVHLHRERRPTASTCVHVHVRVHVRPESRGQADRGNVTAIARDVTSRIPRYQMIRACPRSTHTLPRTFSPALPCISRLHRDPVKSRTLIFRRLCAIERQSRGTFELLEEKVKHFVSSL